MRRDLRFEHVSRLSGHGFREFDRVFCEAWRALRHCWLAVKEPSLNCHTMDTQYVKWFLDQGNLIYVF